MIARKKTKIVATIGPATESAEMLTKLAEAGMDVMRLNFSHGSHEEHQTRVDNLKQASEKTGKTLAVLQDLSGPKIRIGDFYKERVELREGDTFTLTTQEIVGDETKAYVNYPTLPQEVYVEGFILLDDGKKKLQIKEIKDTEIICTVVLGGETKGRRGVNIPGAYLKISSLTEKDRKDLEFGIKNNVDFFALSFVRRPEDVAELREILTARGSKAKIISKIETQEAIDNLDDIIAESDGVMVARGDLAIEVPAETVPLLQKRIIKTCNMLGKPVITATQMLESMIRTPVPTRAEVSDVANAILDGTDAIMLSEETTLGEYPVAAVSMMSKVAREIEASEFNRKSFDIAEKGTLTVPDSISSSVVKTARDVGASLIVVFTEFGFSPRMVSRFKPSQPILILSQNDVTLRQTALSYGCIPALVDRSEGFEGIPATVRAAAARFGLGEPGDTVVVASAGPFPQKEQQMANMLLVETL